MARNIHFMLFQLFTAPVSQYIGLDHSSFMKCDPINWFNRGGADITLGSKVLFLKFISCGKMVTAHTGLGAIIMIHNDLPTHNTQ